MQNLDDFLNFWTPVSGQDISCSLLRAEASSPTPVYHLHHLDHYDKVFLKGKRVKDQINSLYIIEVVEWSDLDQGFERMKKRLMISIS